MKRCTQEHEVPTFGTIPVGSLWADESPYVTDLTMFADVDDAPEPPKAKKAARKFVGEAEPETFIATPDDVDTPSEVTP